MPDWFPEPIWKGWPCYIIGGGPSLEGFPFERLELLPVLGCNAAFYLGVDVVPIMIFGDSVFLKQHETGIRTYAAEGGWVVTCSGRVKGSKRPDFLRIMPRELRGLSLEALGWNGNTGSAAINLALLLGADPIYLLGYDMQFGKGGKANYHNAYGRGRTRTPKRKTYERFIKGMGRVARDLDRLFPGRRVINLEDGTSALDVFPKESLAAHFEDKEE